MNKQVFMTIKDYLVLGVVFVFCFFIVKNGYQLLSSSVVENKKIDKTTSNYISFNYAENDNNIFSIDKALVFSDFSGKHLNATYYDFEILFPNNDNSNKVNYEIILKDMGNVIDGKYVKVYLTDQNNNAFMGYKDVIPVYSALEDCFDGKIIYSGSLTNKNLKKKFRLKIWVSDNYKEKVNTGLSYQINVKLK